MRSTNTRITANTLKVCLATDTMAGESEDTSSLNQVEQSRSVATSTSTSSRTSAGSVLSRLSTLTPMFVSNWLNQCCVLSLGSVGLGRQRSALLRLWRQVSSHRCKGVLISHVKHPASPPSRPSSNHRTVSWVSAFLTVAT